MVRSDAVVAREGRERARVLVCGDPAPDAGLRAVLCDADLDVVGAVDGKGAVAGVATERPALVILDLDGLEGMGFVVCSSLRERYGEALPIILISGERTDVADRVAGLLLGGDDYIMRPFDVSELLARVQRLLKRSAAANGGSSRPRQAGGFRDRFDLTQREQDVLACLVRGLTQIEIAKELSISSNTVAAHIQRILQKLGVRNRAQAVAKAARGGWVPTADGDAEGAVGHDVAVALHEDLDQAARRTVARSSPRPWES